MNLKRAVVLSGFVIVLISATGRVAFAEDAAVAPIDQAVITSDQQPTQKETDMQWAWGEVTNLDNQANTVTLKYLDYETDQEKDLVLVVDEKTTFENIKDFNELKLKDTLSIDYTVGANNKNIAKNISFEKPDISSATPDLAQPTAQSEIPVDSSIAANEVLAPVESASAPAVQEPVPAVQDQAQ
ncbi:MAG: hypothetical protein ACYDFR_00395 [Candidatus Omnitrophota bacterium]